MRETTGRSRPPSLSPTVSTGSTSRFRTRSTDSSPSGRSSGPGPDPPFRSPSINYFMPALSKAQQTPRPRPPFPSSSTSLEAKPTTAPPLRAPVARLRPAFRIRLQPVLGSQFGLNGGLGLVYDRTIINAVQYQQDQHYYLFQQSRTVRMVTPRTPASRWPPIRASVRMQRMSLPPRRRPPSGPFASVH